MFTIITGAQVYDPYPLGVTDVLVADDRIALVGPVDRTAVEAIGVPTRVIDGRGQIVTPGLIDPHEHLIGGSGERGFGSQTPEIMLGELLSAGITTVVGCLGVDTTTRTMPALIAKVKGLNEQGVTAFAYTGGYNVPPTTITGSVRDDLLLIAEIIGAGEVAISDRRSTCPKIGELARLMQEAYVGGLLSGKAGVTHFHVGDGDSRLAPVRALLDEFDMDTALLYPTHVERNEALMQEAVELTRRGITVDIDVVERDLGRWLRFFMDREGDFTRLTISSDAAISSPSTLLDQIRSCVQDRTAPLELLLPLVTCNTARVLCLKHKGRVQPGCDADLLLLREGSLELAGLLARGREMVIDGEVRLPDGFLAESNRRITIHGDSTR